MAAARKGQAAAAAQAALLEAQRLREAQDPWGLLLPACTFTGERRGELLHGLCRWRTLSVLDH
jgi:hypothetical protein